MSALTLINSIPGIAGKRYLELGVHNGATFNRVLARDKTGVDLNVDTTFKLSTDAFFKGLSSAEKWDVIYIDACHEYRQVVRDFNNSVQHLNAGGVILAHDLIPVTQEFAVPAVCGDAHKMLADMLMAGRKNIYPLMVNPKPGHTVQDGGTDGDYGLTLFTSPEEIEPHSDGLSYVDFMALVRNSKTFTLAEVQSVILSMPQPGSQ